MNGTNQKNPSYEVLLNRVQVLEKDQIELEKSISEFKQMFSMLLDMICIADLDTSCFLKVNQAFKTTLGYSEQELIGKSIFDFIHPDDIQSTRAVVDDVLRAGNKVIDFENRYRCKDGSYKWLNWASHPSLEKGVAYAVARDVTQIKLTRKQLQHSEEKYRGLFNTTNDGICLHEVIYEDGEPVDYRILDVNPKYEEATGIKEEDALGALASQLYGTGKAPYLDIFSEVANNGRPVSFETYFAPMEKHFTISVFSPAMHQFATIFQDITKRKQTEKELQESENRYKSLFHNKHSVMLLIDPETGDILDANSAAADYYGWSHDEMTAKKISELNTLSERQIREEMNAARKEHRNVFHFKHRLADGEIRDVEVYSGPIVIHEKKLLYSIIHDITERKKGEEERTRLIDDLRQALSEIKTLRGILPICASCKKIRDDKGYWNQLEAYVYQHSDVKFSHGICPDCAKELYPGFKIGKGKKS